MHENWRLHPANPYLVVQYVLEGAMGRYGLELWARRPESDGGSGIMFTFGFPAGHRGAVGIQTGSLTIDVSYLEQRGLDSYVKVQLNDLIREFAALKAQLRKAVRE